MVYTNSLVRDHASLNKSKAVKSFLFLLYNDVMLHRGSNLVNLHRLTPDFSCHKPNTAGRHEV